MQLFLHAMCSARTLCFHLYATNMPICTVIVVTDVKKKGIQHKNRSALTKRDTTPEKPSDSMLRISSTSRPRPVVALLTPRGADFLEACPGSWAYSV